MIEEWKSSHLSPSVLGDASIQVNRMHGKKPSRKKKPKTGHKPSLAEQLGIHENTLPELVNWMTDEVDVIETVAMEMFALRGELDTTLKDLAEVKSNLVESNRIFNSECICVRDIELTLHPSSHALNPARAEQKSVLASVERDLALKKKEEGALLKSESTELKELRKRVATFTASIIDEKHTALEHMCKVELNEQRNKMNVISHAAKLGNIAQTKAESLAQGQLKKAQQYSMYSANVGGMRVMGSGGMQVPQMSMIAMMGNGGFLPFNQGMIANQMMMPGMQANMMPGMQTGMMPGIQAGMMPGMQTSFVPGMQTSMMPGMMPPTMQTGMGMMPMNCIFH